MPQVTRVVWVAVVATALGACKQAPPAAQTPIRNDSALRALATARLPDVCTGVDTSLHGAGDTPPLRAAAARRYIHTYSIKDAMGGMVDSMAVQIPEARRKAFIDLMTNGVNYDALNTLMCNAVAKHFTVEEIAALTAFYGSPAGRAAMQKYGPYMTDLMPGLMLEMQRAAALSAR